MQTEGGGDTHSSASEATKTITVPMTIQLSSSARPDQCIVKLPQEHAFVLPVLPRNPAEKNVCVEAYFQYDSFSLEGVCQMDLLQHLLKEPFFDSLRTKQQLGYSVSVGAKLTHGVMGLSFAVVSSSHSVEHVQAAIMEFVGQVPALIASIDTNTYKDYVQSLISDFLQPETSLYDAANNIWDEIEERRYLFGLRERQGRMLNSDNPLFSQEGMGAFSRTFLVEAPRLLVVQSFTHVIPQSNEATATATASGSFTATVTNEGTSGGVDAGSSENPLAPVTTTIPITVPAGVPVKCSKDIACVTVSHLSHIHQHSAVLTFPSLV